MQKLLNINDFILTFHISHNFCHKIERKPRQAIAIGYGHLAASFVGRFYQ